MFTTIIKWHLVVVLLLSVSLFSACKSPHEYETLNIRIETMGTWGKIIIHDSLPMDSALIDNGIDSTLNVVNMNFSTYIDSSLLSKFNALDSGKMTVNAEFITLLKSAINYANESDYTFNPKVMPLIAYYGFANAKGHDEIDSSYIKTLVSSINTPLENDLTIDERNLTVEKLHAIQLDFSAFAKGYGVDQVASYLIKKGFKHFMIEIGGEVRTSGHKPDNEAWRLGIEKPDINERSIFSVIKLNIDAMATSGNYRNIRKLKDGTKITHTINPKTGYPEQSNLLSASIVANTCMEADAYATACMVMGLTDCINFIENQNNVHAYLIYSDVDGEVKTYVSEELKDKIE